MKKRIRVLLNDIGDLCDYTRNGRRATTVEVCFNYSGPFLQVEVTPLLALFTVSCTLALVHNHSSLLNPFCWQTTPLQ